MNVVDYGPAKMPTPEQAWQAGSIVLGAVIALIISVVVEIVKAYLGDRRARNRFRLLLQIELPMITGIIDRLVQDHADRGFIPIPLLLQIDTARQGYDRNRDWVIILKDDQVRRDLIDFYHQLAVVCREAQSLEQMALDQANPGGVAWAGGRRPHTVAAFRDVAARGRDLINRLTKKG